MKIPLRYQVSEYDCGTISLLNALSFIIKREEIPAIFLKKIFKYTMDTKDENGNIGQGGTSKKAIKKLTKWFNHFSSKNNLKIKFEYLNKELVTLNKINDCIKNNGCVLVRSYLMNIEHYFIITKIDENKAYIFDPYYLNKNVYQEKGVKIKINKNLTYNRIVKINRLFSNNKEDFSLGEITNRECLLIYKNK